jgi:hypothetical protein
LFIRVYYLYAIVTDYLSILESSINNWLLGGLPHFQLNPEESKFYTNDIPLIEKKWMKGLDRWDLFLVKSPFFTHPRKK